MSTEETYQQGGPRNLSAAVKAFAAELGFDACGIATAGNIDPDDRLGAWLARGFQAGMKWLERNKGLRQDIGLRLPGAKSVVVVGRSYFAGGTAGEAGGTPAPQPAPQQLGRVARYARGRDYHEVLAGPLQALAERIQQMGDGIRCYLSIDTGTVLERAWAQRAGVGWIGKNGLVVRRGLGSWFFLGIVATTLELAPDEPAADQCGVCRRCLDACPTGALVEPRVMDARRCVSYLTIEHRGEVPEELAQRFGERLFGCDTCQEACPYNQQPALTTEPAFEPVLAAMDLKELLGMDEEAFRRRFAGSPILRAGWEGMRRNAGILLR